LNGADDSGFFDSSAAPDDTAALSADPPPGERYDRLGLIGVGGMGRVYLARDRWLGRLVALKEALDERLATRLAREVRVTAGLEHPGIVTVYDEGRGADGRMFYTMRLMRGRPLAQRLAECTSLSTRLDLLTHYLDACQALAYAHAQGVVHCDIKPANVMLGAYGETQVVDWGLARRLADPCEDPPGAVLGTPAYMSPEQARGQPADPRSDVWSLGVVLHELLSGAHASPKAPLPRDVPPELAAIVARATSPDPRVRYLEAGALAADVAAYLDGRRVDAHRYSALEIGLRFLRAWRVPLLVAGAALVIIVALVVASTLRLRTERDRAVAAERDVRTALGASDRNLAAALVAQARAADERGARAATEVLAAHALRLVDTPEARGVLAGARAAARPVRLASAALPACHPLVALAVDDIVCADDTTLRRVTAGEERWRATTGRQTKELRVDAGHAWAITYGFGAVTVDLESGAPDEAAWDIVDFNVGDAWPRRSDDPPGFLQAQLLQVCGGGVIGVAGLVDGPYVVLCADGWLGRTQAMDPPELAPVFNNAMFDTFTHIALTADARQVIVAGSRGRVATHALGTSDVWSIDSPRGDPVRRIALAPDGQRAAIARERGGVELYELPDLRPIGTIAATGVRDLRLLADGSVLIADAVTATRWALPALPRPDVFADEHGIAGVAFSPDSRTLVTAHGEGRVVVWDLADGTRRHTIAIGRGTVKAAAFFPDSDRFAVVQSDRGPPGPHVFSVASGQPVWAPPGLAQQSRRVVILGDSLVLSAPYANELRATDIDDGREVPPHDCPQIEWLDLATDVRGRHAILASVDAAVYVVDPGPPLLCRPVPAPPGAYAVDVASDGRVIVVGAAHSLSRGEPDGLVWTVPHPGVRPNDVALSPDGRWVASAGPDDAARLWDAATGALRAVLTGHDARVAVVEFSPDGRVLATGSWDGTARLWDLATLDIPVDALVADAENTWGIDLNGALAR